MPIKIHQFMGRLGWALQKRIPNLSSNSYLAFQMLSRRRSQKAYIDYFYGKKELPKPLIVNLETINRCNSTCAFCTANVHAEKRPYQKMEEPLFYRIIDQLKEWGYKGHLTLYGNNEPWLDTRIVEFHQYCRKQLPDCFIFMSTNGLMLDLEKVKAIVPYIDQLVINNYCLDRKMHENIRKIYTYVRQNPKEFEEVDILIQIRYLDAVLSNRAGSAPNKRNKTKVITETCLMPFTDIFIFPDGRLGICCCDNFEVTKMADLNEVTIQEAWDSEVYQKARAAIGRGRQNYSFCRHCDFIDAGLRMDAVEDVLKNTGMMRGARQSLLQKSKKRKK